ncbi:uncharacterized protein LOC100876782 isoform X2 [Megachile rotundata]|uniref:uncharacterized protein LOC100876782 isoform X2 n=1 Tax=Megachile rotundata TaxID=143995 RepID=UPI000614F52A|nr:PREDICTED: uncharacterized protein LOC100876782 [Megachile rotundata]XP_012152047.1 PREDICTED: uncharacterized protein LOC100876782 [Megachile rotundata]XP_012152048.1 PREDICTED: uncharacterized protein LOC100876782 [Megachile rotundata]
MCVTVAALASQTVLLPREIMYFSKNASRFYHRNRKLCRVNNFLSEKYFLPSFITDKYTVQRTRYSSESKLAFPGALTKEKAKNVASKLTAEEREFFLKALEECKSEDDRAQYQSQLAAFRWCNKFGRPSKITSLGDVDPTGSYCVVPDDWLMRKYVETVPEPSVKDLILVAIANAIPFIGFGFLDNFIMIVAGDQIEIMLNKRFPISTIAAAALGNTISDIIGIGSVHYVERLAQRIGFEAPKLTPVQLNLKKTKAAANMGRVVGVTIGCLIGMTPIPIFSYFHHTG